MSTDLSIVLGHAVDELSSTVAPDELLLASLRRSVRRRRVQRHTVESVVGVAAAGVVGTAVWAGLRFDAPPPAVEPTPTVAPTPSATPTPTASATPAVSPTATATETPSLGSWVQPSSVPVTAAILAGAEEGWVLAVYAPEYVRSTADGNDERIAVGRPVLYLVSPSGDRYRMFDVPRDVHLVHWTAGERRALVSLESGPHRWLDLQTGQLSATGGPSDDDSWVGVDAAGRTIWQAPSGDVLALAADGTSAVPVLPVRADPVSGTFSPDRRLVTTSFGAVDLEAGFERFWVPPVGSSTCRPAGWLSGSEAVIRCADLAGVGSLYSVAFPAEPRVSPWPQPLAFDGIAPGSVNQVVPLGDGRLVVQGTDAATQESVVVMVDGSAVSTVWRASLMVESAFVAVSGGTLVLVVDADDTPDWLAAYDDATGATTVLVPRPPDGEAPGVGAVWWQRGMTSWTVATTR
ncbi:hypothetical protein Cch01nite_14160 [Cellulomonas chitinilytica]|uniref:Uncharacterized protein n=1 Tax=Cellulomonas chitinilytica TaxID=398759 RepID=A0A919U1P1_9CELL|nr:hypothetical protein [Cellulomonas chitinilytica]GIG20692.1 hypothetical protein Cch01nite_14160 [Cellulomonas chitinilytica]